MTTIETLAIPSRFLTPIAFSPKGKPLFLIGGGDGTTPIPADPPAPVNSAQTDPLPDPVGQGDKLFSQADIDAAIEKARKQEKDKLYGKIDSATAQIAELKKAEEERLAAIEAERKAKAAAEKAAAEAEMSAKELIDRREAEWKEQLASVTKGFEDRFASLNTERENERALHEKERQFAELQAFTQRRLNEEQNHIAPELLDLVNGSNEMEIEQSIALLKQKSQQMAENVRAALQETQQRGIGTRPTGYSTGGPLEFQAGQQQYTAEDIRNMDMKQFAEFRSKLGIGGGSNNRGLFG